MKTPCEIFVWYVLPGIRQELAVCMIEELGQSQANVARRLGLTDAAVSQYVSKKRGNIELEPDVKRELSVSAKRIMDGDETVVVRELCRICGITRESQVVQELYKEHTGITIRDCGI